jgi:hypothetical protein
MLPTFAGRCWDDDLLPVPATERSIAVVFCFSRQGFAEHDVTVDVFQVYRQSLASFVNVDFTEEL